jgi:hypothetical protein
MVKNTDLFFEMAESIVSKPARFQTLDPIVFDIYNDF